MTQPAILPLQMYTAGAPTEFYSAPFTQQVMSREQFAIERQKPLNEEHPLMATRPMTDNPTETIENALFRLQEQHKISQKLDKDPNENLSGLNWLYDKFQCYSLLSAEIIHKREAAFIRKAVETCQSLLVKLDKQIALNILLIKNTSDALKVCRQELINRIQSDPEDFAAIYVGDLYLSEANEKLQAILDETEILKEQKKLLTAKVQDIKNCKGDEIVNVIGQINLEMKRIPSLLSAAHKVKLTEDMIDVNLRMSEVSAANQVTKDALMDSTDIISSNILDPKMLMSKLSPETRSLLKQHPQHQLAVLLPDITNKSNSPSPPPPQEPPQNQPFIPL